MTLSIGNVLNRQIQRESGLLRLGLDENGMGVTDKGVKFLFGVIKCSKIR